MNLDKVENPYTNRVDEEISEGYPLMQNIQNRPTQFSLNRSVDQQRDFEVYDPSIVQQPRVDISGTGNVIQPQQAAFNPVPVQKHVKKCSKCLVIYSFLSIAICMITIFVYTIKALSSDGTISWTDIDGQKLNINVPSNWGCVVYFCILMLCALGIKQAKITIRLFKPILKEYKNAETGVTSGIVMNQRKSKKMLKFKKRLCKIIFAAFFFYFISMVYQCQISDNTTAQYIEQKYDYIIRNNDTNGLPYSVENMINQEKTLDNKQDEPQYGLPQETQEENIKKTEKKLEDQKEDLKKTEKELEDEVEAFEEKMPWHQIPIEGAPFRPDVNQTELWGHHHGHHGHNHKHHRQQSEDDEPEHKKKPKHHPYKEWLNKLPFMDQETAFKQAQHFERNKIIGKHFGLVFWYCICQFIFILCVNKVIKNQKILEEKYMGPEIRSVCNRNSNRSSVRQYSVIGGNYNLVVQPNVQQQRVAPRQPEPVIQYNMAPQVSQTGNIVSTNQMA